jgi:hypothetical protein
MLQLLRYRFFNDFRLLIKSLSIEIEIFVSKRAKSSRELLTLEEGKEPVRPTLPPKLRNSRFGRRKMLAGNFPRNPQFPKERIDKEDDKFFKEVGTTRDIFTHRKRSSLNLVRF